MSKDYSEDQKDGMKQEKTKTKSMIWSKFFSKEEKGKESSKKNFVQRVGIGNFALLLICGILFIYLCCMKDPATKTEEKKSSKATPTQSTSLDTSNTVETNTDSEEYVEKLEKKLKDTLSLVQDIGKVEVMITLAESKELITLKDAPYTHDSVDENDGDGGSRNSETTTRGDETVMTTREDGGVEPYIVKEIQPTISGVLVIAQGGGDSRIEVEIVEAVEALFDVPVHKIKVMEMKQQAK